jgi:hypothetical protein
LRANCFHEIAGEAVASGCIDVEYAYAWIETERSGSQSRFGFEEGIEIIQNRVWWIDRKPR